MVGIRYMIIYASKHFALQDSLSHPTEAVQHYGVGGLPTRKGYVQGDRKDYES